jgi:outer membrane lipoprotein-sorting protein
VTLRALRSTSPALALFVAAACGHEGSSTEHPPVASASVVPTVSIAPTASAASSAGPLPSADPVPTAEPTPSASATPKLLPPRPAHTVHVDAGAPDAGTLAALGTGAAPASPGLEVARHVDAIFASKKTFFAHFKQQYTPFVSGTVKDSSGVVYVERPSKISFRYDPPSKNRIVSDGTTIKVYLGDDNQMIQTPVDKTQYPGALAFMMGNGIATSFDFTVNTRAQYAGTVLEGKPLVPNPSYETVLFFVDAGLLAKGDAGAMARVLILDAQKNKNRFDFTGATQPATISPDEFIFTPPPGTTILP